ncbi:MAG TPA: hypothetical protein VNY52_09570 [Solirubrobacteraceae bacterium]|jgi:hypothetical protein|nr:hypothetical protein [Solirubrobacteraceae bacterium]
MHTRSTSIALSRIAACACATLALLAPRAAASEAGNVLGGAPQSSSQAAKPAGGAAKPATGATKLTPQQKQQLTSEAQKQLQSQLASKSGASGAAATKKTAATTTETSSKTSTPMILALVAAGLLLGGVAFVIVRDARSVAPVVEGAMTGGTRNPEARLRKRRARAKAAKQQRRRNR